MRAVAPGHDIRLGPQDVENNRNFATKLWNAARFVEFNGAARVEGFDPKSAKETLNRWIAHETEKAAAEITQAIEAYGFSEAAGAAYRFVWNVYCDWYVELSKPLLTGPDGPAKDETRAMAAWALDEILKLLHPFMPFITEELWRVTAEQGPKRSNLLALSDWPQLEGLADEAAEAEIGWVIDLVTAIRSMRAEMNITAPIPLVLAGATKETQARAERWAEFIQKLVRVSEISSADAAPQGSVQLVVRGEVAALPLKGVIDLAAERARLGKELGKAEADIERVDAKLGNREVRRARAGRGGRGGEGKARGSARPQGQDRRGAGAAQGRGVSCSNLREASALSLSPCGRGWLARRESEREPGEGSGLGVLRRPLTRLAHFVRSAPSPTRGEGRKKDDRPQQSPRRAEPGAHRQERQQGAVLRRRHAGAEG